MKSHKTEADRMNELHGERITRLEVTQEHIFQALSDIKSLIKDMDSRLNARMDKLENRMDRIESRLDKIESRMWVLHLWNLAGFATVLGIMAHGFGWF